jgi:hypothetical protein
MMEGWGVVPATCLLPQKSVEDFEQRKGVPVAIGQRVWTPFFVEQPIDLFNGLPMGLGVTPNPFLEPLQARRIVEEPVKQLNEDAE